MWTKLIFFLTKSSSLGPSAPGRPFMSDVCIWKGEFHKLCLRVKLQRRQWEPHTTKLQYETPSYLSILQGIESRVHWCTDDLVVRFKLWDAHRWWCIVHIPALTIAHGVVLPWCIGGTIYRPLQHPVARPWGVCCLHYHICYLVYLETLYYIPSNLH